MIAFPNCKINIGLNVIHKRSDGYHDLETVFYPLDLCEALELISLPNDNKKFTVTGLPVINNQNNLCIKAYDLVKRDFPKLPFIKMHLHKAIPLGAGLGGGGEVNTVRRGSDRSLHQLTIILATIFGLSLILGIIT